VKLVPLMVAAAAVALLPFVAAQAAEAAEVPPAPGATTPARLYDAMRSAGVPSGVARFVAVVPVRETGGTYDPRLARGRREGAPAWARVNVDGSEAAAALRGYERNVARYPVGRIPAHYTFGSGGLYGLLPSTALAGWPADDEGIVYAHPWHVLFDVAASTASALRLVGRAWRYEAMRERPSMTNLRRFWAGTGYLVGANPTDDERASYEASAATLAAELVSAGLAPSLGQAEQLVVEPLPGFFPDEADDYEVKLRAALAGS
jgi:hypothetical protein